MRFDEPPPHEPMRPKKKRKKHVLAHWSVSLGLIFAVLGPSQLWAVDHGCLPVLLGEGASSTAVRPNGRPRWRSDAIHANLATGDAADGGGGARWVRWPTERVERGGGRALSRAFPMGDRWRWAEDPWAAAVPFRRIRRSPAAAAALVLAG
jgi:hypothetical protein